MAKLPERSLLAERNLEPDASSAPVRHPLVDTVFRIFIDGYYSTAGRIN
jgi:heat shock protein HspQ